MWEPPIIDREYLSTGERKTFHRCIQAWWWAYVNGLKAKSKPADALWFGAGIHEALAEWYGEEFDRGQNPAKTFRLWVGHEMRAIKASMPDREREAFDEPVYIDAKELGTAMLRAYLDRYGEDPDWEVIAVEQPFQIELTRNGRTVAVFAGIFDGAVIDHSDGEPYLMEHKTASSIRTAHLALDDQAGSYFAVATQVLRHQGIIGRKQNIFGIMYNFLRKSKPDERDRNEGGAYLNKDGKVSKRQPPPAFHREPVDRSPREVGAILRRITNEAILMDKVRTGKLPVTKTITDNCPYCPFYTMCVLHERGGNSYLQFMRTNYKIEGPYLDTERKSAAE